MLYLPNPLNSESFCGCCRFGAHTLDMKEPKMATASNVSIPCQICSSNAVGNITLMAILNIYNIIFKRQIYNLLETEFFYQPSNSQNVGFQAW